MLLLLCDRLLLEFTPPQGCVKEREGDEESKGGGGVGEGDGGMGGEGGGGQHGGAAPGP